MKIINTIWFTTMQAHTIGVVIGEDEVTGKHKAYIGLGDGIDEESDTRRIAEYGTPFPIEAANKLYD